MVVGMKVMATFNVETDLDIANGARGEIVEIVLSGDRDSDSIAARVRSVRSAQNFPGEFNIHSIGAYILDPCWESEILPLSGPEFKLPLTAAVAFTEYRSQGQSTSHATQ
jgi:hypothetical protein